MRAALHAHILCFYKLRKKPENYTPLGCIKRTAPGSEPRQRPREQTVEPLPEPQHDNVYHHAHVARISGEMVRPDVSGKKWGGYDVEMMRIAGLARAVLSRLPYLHSCTPLYCLKNRSACRLRLTLEIYPHLRVLRGGPSARDAPPQFSMLCWGSVFFFCSPLAR